MAPDARVTTTAPAPGGALAGGPGAGAGPARRIVDPEHVVSGADRTRLTIAPVCRALPGRVQVLDGPVPLRPGLVATGRVLPAHAGSEDVPIEPLRVRLRVWVTGSGYDHLLTRLRGLVTRPRREPHLRRLRRWVAMRPRRHARPAHLDNLSVGLFAPGDSAHPLAGLTFHATGPTNAALFACSADRRLELLGSVANVGLTWLVAVSGDGLLVGAGSVAGNGLLATEPECSPLALFPVPAAIGEVLSGVSVAAVGQHGFSTDTIVTDQRIVPGPDPLPTGGEGFPGWACWRDRGTGAFAASTLLGEPPGLVRLSRDRADGELVISWRGDQGELAARYDGTDVELTVGAQRAATHVPLLRGAVELHLVVLPGAVAVYLLGDTISASVRVSTGPGDGGGELRAASGGSGQVGVVAFPRRIAAPLLPPTDLLTDPQWTVTQSFDGPPRATLASLATDDGRRWQRWCGERDFVIGGDGLILTPGGDARGRTIWAVPWDDPHGAAVAVGLVPAGRGPGEGAHCAAGVALGSDADNVLLVNAWADDSYGGGSVSSFLRLDGWEEVYDAVWVNVGDRVRPGHPIELGVRFDGDRYLVALDGRVVLERAVSDVYPAHPPLAVRGLGILANWEWGSDSGSLVRYFRAARLRRPGKER